MSQSLKPIVDLVNNNLLVSAIVAALVAAAIIAVLTWTLKSYRDRRDSRKIFDFLLKSKDGTNYCFRSTAAISSDTKIPENRVAELCSRHPKIKRNEKEKQSWRLMP